MRLRTDREYSACEHGCSDAAVCVPALHDRCAATADRNYYALSPIVFNRPPFPQKYGCVGSGIRVGYDERNSDFGMCLLPSVRIWKQRCAGPALHGFGPQVCLSTRAV